MTEIDELLASVRRKYATASTYADSGCMVFSGGSLDGQSAVFETKFERRGRVLSLRFSTEGDDDIALSVSGDHIQILPAVLHALLPTNRDGGTREPRLADAVAILYGVTSGVAHHVFSMLLPEANLGSTPCSDAHEYRVKERPSTGRDLWVLESSVVLPSHEIILGPDLLLRGYNVRGIVTNTTDILIEYAPELEGP